MSMNIRECVIPRQPFYIYIILSQSKTIIKQSISYTTYSMYTHTYTLHIVCICMTTNNKSKQKSKEIKIKTKMKTIENKTQKFNHVLLSKRYHNEDEMKC